MFLKIQNQVRDQIKRNMRGKALQLEEPYEGPFQEWTNQNKAVLYKLSAEERAQSFADFLEDKVQARLLALIEEKHVDAEKTQALKNQAERGNLLLVSLDGGKTFDQFLTSEEQDQMSKDPRKAMELLILSPSFRSITNNFQEVREEQNLIHVVRNLREQHFLVKNVWLEEGHVHVQVAHPRYGDYEVQVNLKRPSAVPLVYEFINAEGVKQMPETQLPEEYGEAKEDITLRKPSEEELLTLRMTQEQTDTARAALLAGVASSAAALAASRLLEDQALHLAQARAAELAKRAEQEAERTRAQMERPLMPAKGEIKLPTVMAAKAAMAARFARQSKTLEEAKKRELLRFEQAKAQEKQALEQKKAREQERHKTLQASTNSFAKKVALGLGTAGGFLASLGGAGWFVTHINLLT